MAPATQNVKRKRKGRKILEDFAELWIYTSTHSHTIAEIIFLIIKSTY